ncbi:MAG: hypothetical protein H6R07_3292 [Proteobacteria bacterium]|nr:hypothetical protein [Pseudomonadota bacterium]
MRTLESPRCCRCKQIAWFLGLWLAGVAGTGLVAGLIKFGMQYLK